MRTGLAISCGIVIGVAAAGLVYLAVERPTGPLFGDAARVDEARRLPAAVSRVAVEPDPTAAPSRPSRATPVTPDYGSRPDAARPIYRCKSRGATVYADEPCAGATVIVGADRVAGYDSRPSERLAQMVAEGRTADASGPPVAPRSTTARTAETVECATFRQQILDIDAAALRPASHESLDEWRRIRQDIRTSMARRHC